MSRFVIRLSACLALLLSLPLAQASATSQFSLNPKKHASKCFVECHDRVVDTIPLPDGEPNNQGYIGPNCANPDYTQLITMCITQLCPSPSDAAYAAEYAVSWCGRAGVDVKIELPQTYLDQEAAYFQSTEYLSRGTQGVKNWGLGGVVLLGLPALMVLFVL